MRFQYLGTAAAEGFPAIFCNCEYCQNARRLKGKNIRTRSQAIIDRETFVGFSRGYVLSCISVRA